MEKVKIGDSIKVIKMEGEPDYSNRVGTVTAIDGIGQLHGTWGGLAIIPEKDTYQILKENNNNGNH
ncbi:MAG: DUF4314 domain-containing protein [Eubacteriales bacterium]|nr:DUF4314 domain-containing protein [Eubacteriales bacterium]